MLMRSLQQLGDEIAVLSDGKGLDVGWAIDVLHPRANPL